MAALGVHQHRVDNERIAFPFPPQALRPPRHVSGIAPLQHDAFDGFGVRAGSGRSRIGARRRERGPAVERHQRREIDARIIELFDKGLQPCAPLHERPVAKVFGAVDQQIIGPQMRGKFR